MPKRYLITAALPYANGSPHLGHLTEYLPADIYTRALKAMGHEVAFLCASDAHGTPIELNAKKQGITPEALVERSRKEQIHEFGRYDIRFDVFGSTHDASNRELVESTYAKLLSEGHIERREILGNFCEKDQRFLPDRFIRGGCPRCLAGEQYGDVCERCGATYAPTDLIDAACALCGDRPVAKPSEHLFFRLSSDLFVSFLRDWIDSGALQADVANYVRSWIETGLKDWCISRDGPYHGFTIPHEVNKYFYVWLDAPVAYLAQAQQVAKSRGQTLEQLWNADDVQIEHIIGKDIMYFHTLFWPAILKATKKRTPTRVHVHGMLTVNGEKMSKSRGTFIAAKLLADHVDPQAIRFYFACKQTAQTSDLDLSFEDVAARVNGELVNKHVNLFSRVTQFLRQKLDGKYGKLPFTQAEAHETTSQSACETDLLFLARRAVLHAHRIESLLMGRELGAAMRELALLADVGNETMQARMPWAELKRDPEAARLTCTFAAHICYALAMYLTPVVPRLAQSLVTILGLENIPRMDANTLFGALPLEVGPAARLFERIDVKVFEKVVAQSTVATTAPDGGSTKEKKGASVSSAAKITYDDFMGCELRVGRVLTAEPLKKSKKLLKLSVDTGEPCPRQIVAGLALAYQPTELVGKDVIVVANLAPTHIMGELSEGMVLAGEDETGLAIVTPGRSLTAGARVR